MDINIQGKKINFNEEISNLNLIQNKNNSNIYKTALKEENKCSFFLSPKKPSLIDPVPNPPIPTSSMELINNKLNLAPNANKVLDNIKENKNTNNYILKNNKKINCTCTRTQCQKKYCACFSHGISCQGCDCKGCLNTSKDNINNNLYQNNEIYDIKNEETNNNGLRYQENTGKIQQAAVCNCTKSRCVKKYCECFKINVSCGSMCRCMDCDNKNNIMNNNNNINNIINNNNENINDEEDNQIDYEINIEKIKYLCQLYDIHAFGVFIHNKKLIIQERFVDMNSEKINININTTPKLTNKKRNRNKNENSVLKTCPTTNTPARKKRRGIFHK